MGELWALSTGQASESHMSEHFRGGASLVISFLTFFVVHQGRHLKTHLHPKKHFKNMNIVEERKQGTSLRMSNIAWNIKVPC